MSFNTAVSDFWSCKHSYNKKFHVHIQENHASKSKFGSGRMIADCFGGKQKGMNGLSKYKYSKELYGICLLFCHLKCLEYNIVKDPMNMVNFR